MFAFPGECYENTLQRQLLHRRHRKATKLIASIDTVFMNISIHNFVIPLGWTVEPQRRLPLSSFIVSSLVYISMCTYIRLRV